MGFSIPKNFFPCPCELILTSILSFSPTLQTLIMELSRKLSTAIAPITYVAKWKNHVLPAVAIEPLAPEEAERSLKIGDQVSLFSIEHGGYISSDGCVFRWRNRPGIVSRKDFEANDATCTLFSAFLQLFG